MAAGCSSSVRGRALSNSFETFECLVELLCSPSKPRPAHPTFQLNSAILPTAAY
eukprot:COSAG02_NODE_24361_length_690_cov_1.544839_1_plen_53_part_10